MVNVRQLSVPDRPEGLEDLDKLERRFPPTESVSETPPPDSFSAAMVAPEAKQVVRGRIPAIHLQFSRLDGRTVPKVAPVLAAQVTQLTGQQQLQPAVPPDKLIAIGISRGRQLYTTSAYQAEGVRELGIAFCIERDGTRTYLVGESGPDRPLGEEQFQDWYAQKIRAQLEKAKLTQLTRQQTWTQFAGVDLANANYLQSLPFSAADIAKVHEAAQDAVSDNPIFLMNEQGRKAGHTYRQEHLEGDRQHHELAEGTRHFLALQAQTQKQVPPTPGKRKTEAKVPQEILPSSQQGLMVPVPGPVGSRSAETVELSLTPPANNLPERLQRNAEQPGEQAQEQQLLEEREAVVEQSHRSEELSTERLAENERVYKELIQKGKEEEKSEEMLTLLRISHASRRFEGRFASLAEKSFLTLINSPLVRRPDDAAS